MTNQHPELSSAATALDDLIATITAHADALADRHEDLATDLYEVERSLRAGSRRLAAVVRRLAP